MQYIILSRGKLALFVCNNVKLHFYYIAQLLFLYHVVFVHLAEEISKMISKSSGTFFQRNMKSAAPLFRVVSMV